jgi:hypothetical protein
VEIGEIGCLLPGGRSRGSSRPLSDIHRLELLTAKQSLARASRDQLEVLDGTDVDASPNVVANVVAGSL